jgi:hypothetical protein
VSCASAVRMRSSAALREQPQVGCQRHAARLAGRQLGPLEAEQAHPFLARVQPLPCRFRDRPERTESRGSRRRGSAARRSRLAGRTARIGGAPRARIGSRRTSVRKSPSGGPGRCARRFRARGPSGLRAGRCSTALPRLTPTSDVTNLDRALIGHKTGGAQTPADRKAQHGTRGHEGPLPQIR